MSGAPPSGEKSMKPEDERNGCVGVQALAKVGVIGQREYVEPVTVGLLCHPQQLRFLADDAVCAKAEDDVLSSHGSPFRWARSKIESS